MIRITHDAFVAYAISHGMRTEYYDGVIVDLPPGSPEHALIAANMIRSVGNAVDGTDCFVYTGDLMIEVESANSFLLPDLAVICGKAEKSTTIPGAIRNPKLLVEVLSDSTRKRDQGIKWFHYRMLPGLKEFITIEQSKPLVFVHTLNTSNEWVQTAYGDLNDVIHIRSLAISIPMKAIFAGIDFEG
jgi:Uma2 family endonuclease